MGATVSAIIPVASVVAPVIWAITGLIHAIRSGQPQANPTLKDIENAARLQRKQKKRENAAQAAKEKADRLAREAAVQAEMARQAQQEAKNAVRAAREDAERARREAKEARAAAKRQADAQHAEAQKRESQLREEAQRHVVEVEEERRHIERVQSAARRQQQLADEETRRARSAQLAAEAAALVAAKEARRAQAAKEEAERQLREGIQPVIMPSAEDLKLAKQRIDYRDGLYHFAIAGVAGSGKSSLINAFRGLHESDDGAAATGITETTLCVARFPDADSANPFVWYDIPGAGTIQVPDWQYFNEQGLYVFDAIIVLIGERVMSTDIAILRNCRLFGIPSYIVRSKADMHVHNMVRRRPRDSKDKEQLEHAAREKFISETRQSVRTNLQAAGLPDQRVYIVSDLTLFGVVKGLVSQEMEKEIIDECELIERILSDANQRRGTRPVAPSTHDL